MWRYHGPGKYSWIEPEYESQELAASRAEEAPNVVVTAEDSDRHEDILGEIPPAELDSTVHWLVGYLPAGTQLMSQQVPLWPPTKPRAVGPKKTLQS